ncbi:MAG: hypothetical protein AAF597_08980, partial [Bacteroidota bacterium]
TPRRPVPRRSHRRFASLGGLTLRRDRIAAVNDAGSGQSVNRGVIITELGKHLTKENPAVVATDRSGRRYLLAQYDILQAI